MRQYLVVANRTVESPQLLEAIQDRRRAGPAAFHLLVPEDHNQGMTWDESEARAEAKHRLAHAIDHFAALGITMTGDVDATPVDGVANILRRDGGDRFDEILISTLPTTVSRWFKMDAPTRIQRLTPVPVTHIAAALVPS